MSYQNIVIVGNLGGDPEMRYMPDGKPVTNFSVATNRKWNNANGEPQEETTWFRVAAWGNQAEACNEYLKKGRQVLVEGRLKPDANTGGPTVYRKSDGMAGASFEITANAVRFLGGNGNGNGNGNGGGIPYGAAAESESDEIPF